MSYLKFLDTSKEVVKSGDIILLSLLDQRAIHDNSISFHAVSTVGYLAGVMYPLVYMAWDPH